MLHVLNACFQQRGTLRNARRGGPSGVHPTPDSEVVGLVSPEGHAEGSRTVVEGAGGPTGPRRRPGCSPRPALSARSSVQETPVDGGRKLAHTLLPPCHDPPLICGSWEGSQPCRFRGPSRRCPEAAEQRCGCSLQLPPTSGASRLLVPGSLVHCFPLGVVGGALSELGCREERVLVNPSFCPPASGLAGPARVPAGCHTQVPVGLGFCPVLALFVPSSSPRRRRLGSGRTSAPERGPGLRG